MSVPATSTVQRLRPNDESVVESWVNLVMKVAASQPETATPCPVDLRASLRFWPPNTGLENWVLADGTEVVAALQLSYPDKGTTMFVDQLIVQPESRRSGLATELLSHAAERAREHGRTSLVGALIEQYDEAHPRSEGPAAFAAQAGASRVECGLNQRLHLDTEVRMRARAAARETGGYRLERWGSQLPDQWVKPTSDLEASLGDKPAPPRNPNRTVPGRRVRPVPLEETFARKLEAMRLGRGRRAYQLGVLAPGGELAGFTSISLTSSNSVEGFQGMTVVGQAHRGRGLGRLLKAANLLYALESETELQVLDTANDVANEHMIAVNRWLGYQPIDLRAFWKLDLAD